MTREPATLKPTPRIRKKSTSKSIPQKSNKNVKVDVPLVGDLRKILKELMPNVEASDRREWNARIAN